MDEQVEETLRGDPVMARLIDEHGPVTVEPAEEPFRRLCVSIVNQLVSTAAAETIRERAFAVLDDEVTPERVLATDPADLRAAGLSESKVDYLRSAARAFQERDLRPAELSELSDEAVVERLTEIRGVGEWTARMYLLFVLERPDILPLGDLAVRRGIENLYADDGEELTRAEMREIAEAWRPHRSVATRYIWAEYEAD